MEPLLLCLPRESVMVPKDFISATIFRMGETSPRSEPISTKKRKKKNRDSNRARSSLSMSYLLVQAGPDAIPTSASACRGMLDLTLLGGHLKQGVARLGDIRLWPFGWMFGLASILLPEPARIFHSHQLPSRQHGSAQTPVASRLSSWCYPLS